MSCSNVYWFETFRLPGLGPLGGRGSSAGGGGLGLRCVVDDLGPVGAILTRTSQFLGYGRIIDAWEVLLRAEAAPGRTLLAPTPGTADPVDGGQARSLVVFRSQRSLSGCRGRQPVTGSRVFVPGKQNWRRGMIVRTSSRLGRRRWNFQSLDSRRRKSINGSWRSTA